MEIVKPNGSFFNFYQTLPKTFFILQMSKNKAQIWNEHLLNSQNSETLLPLKIPSYEKLTKN